MAPEGGARLETRDRFDLGDLATLRTQPRMGRSGPAVLPLVASLLMIGLATTMAFAMAMQVPFSHDEHQFVAGGWLLGQRGLLPYRDFPFHHLPNLLLLYAPLSGLTAAPFWTARVVSAGLAGATFGILFWYSWRRDRSLPGWSVGAVASALLVFSPLFEYTSGRAWNHALPTAFAVAAFGMHLSAARRPDRPGRWAWSGALVGLAVGSRLTYGLAAIPFLGFIQFGQPPGFRIRPAALFVAGMTCGLLPSLVLFGLAPAQFAYGNLGYQLLNTRYREVLGEAGAMDLAGKLGLLGEYLIAQPAQVLLFAAFGVVVGAGALRPQGLGPAARQEFWFAVGVAAFLGLGAFAATPAWIQYFYAPLPFVVLGLAIYLVGSGSGRKAARLAAVLLVAIVAGLRLEAARAVATIADPEAWIPARVHALGQQVAGRVRSGPLLTLAPIVAIEAGMEFYPALVGGPFDWRVSGFLDPDRREAYRVVGPEELEAMLVPAQAGAILTGVEANNEGFLPGDRGGLERPLAAYGAKHGYPMVTLADGSLSATLSLWLAPAPSGEG